ncbi:shikimate dehydrogenase [uncultured Phenylobacterium sp.]|uniref:shikimate dehydrogenase n=1 Tax=uncultured Phenylobacterium sp. TaxID=349273 RepID=UPI0025F34EDF|nr:shikimate dehydrogenase [uncultured Phenylobacterium sp.]
MITGRTVVAGVAGQPVAHSLSPVLHNAWLAAAGLDGVYVAFPLARDGFERFARGLQGGAVRGLNVTVPFKEAALAVADGVSEIAQRSGAANVLTFEADGRILADNTDGLGLLQAFAVQAPAWEPAGGPVVVLGAGGAARGAVAALLLAGAPKVFVINRTHAKAEALARTMGSRAVAMPMSDAPRAFAQATAVINATSAGLSGEGDLDAPLGATDDRCVVMDMVYRPLETPFLKRARALGRTTVDGLEMLIGQARPSFETFFGEPPPADVDVRALALAHMETTR